MATMVKAAWALTLAAERGTKDLVLGQTVNARSSPIHNINKVLGYCLNFIPVRGTLQPYRTVHSLLAHAQGTCLDTIIQHQNIPLNHLMPLEVVKSKFALNRYFRPTQECFIFTEQYEDSLGVQLCVNPNVMGLDRAHVLHAKLAERIVGL
ncbi:hypothetical protein BDV12DRAFT_203689 [Aspergillus spectabilis]